MPAIESLHTHTTLSDGKLTHLEMFELAESLGVSVVAFTDHDAVPSPETMTLLETLRDRKTKWVIGIEVTADLPKELRPNSASIHIIGLFVDPKNEALREHCNLAQEARVRRMKKIVENLQRLGFNITEEDCLEMSGGESVGRPHIVSALAKYPENNLVTERIRLEMANDSDPKVQARYRNMMERGENQYPYELFLSPGAYRDGYVEYDYVPDLDLAVKLIRDAGGIAVIAHYHTIRSKMPLEFFDKLLQEKRIDGAEVVYGLREYGTTSEKIINDERAKLREILSNRVGLALGGSDAHTKEEMERYVESGWFSNETIGFTEKILATGRVSKKFSSL